MKLLVETAHGGPMLDPTQRSTIAGFRPSVTPDTPYVRGLIEEKRVTLLKEGLDDSHTDDAFLMIYRDDKAKALASFTKPAAK